MKVLPYQPDHHAGVVATILPIQRAEFGIAITLEAQPDLVDIGAFYQHGAGNFWVAVDAQDDVIGTLALLDIGNGQAALRKMFVRREWRGAQHGVAQALLRTLLIWAQAHDLREIFLGTTSAFVAAHRFYEKHGFVQVARDALPARFPVMEVDSRFYRLAPGAADGRRSPTLDPPPVA